MQCQLLFDSRQRIPSSTQPLVPRRRQQKQKSPRIPRELPSHLSRFPTNYRVGAVGGDVPLVHRCDVVNFFSHRLGRVINLSPDRAQLVQKRVDVLVGS